MIARASIVIAFASMLVGCSDDVPSPPSAASIMATASAKGTASEPVDAPIPPVAFDVLDRVGKVRDPFQPEVAAPVCKPGDACDPARRDQVAFGDVEVGSLRVRGTASTGRAGHAIVADGSGRTRVVAPGERIGAARRDDEGSLTEWSIDRIRNGDVVLNEVQSGFPTGKTYVLGGSS